MAPGCIIYRRVSKGALLCSGALLLGLGFSSLRAAPVTVGTKGNEPLVTIAPDGTLYISALQHIYRSTDSGGTWTELPGPIYASQLNLNSDSSIAVDPGNRLYFTFDYPYAGTTAVCTSDDKGTSWACNPAVVPGGTDRMWVLAPSNSVAYEVTNQGLYETAFLTSTDRGTTWVPRALATGLLEPQTGPLFQKACSSSVLQAAKIYGNSDAEAQVQFYVYEPSSTGAILSEMRPTGLKLPTALPSAALSLDGILYVASEEANAAGGRHVVVARSADEGKSWTKLPPLPSTATGTATFSWVAAGDPGHIGVIYYYTTDNGAPGTLANSTWSVFWAESFNGDSASPTWTVTTLEDPIHKGAICIAADCMGANRFAGDFINSLIDSKGIAHLTWMKRDVGTGAISIRYTSLMSGPLATSTPAPCNSTTPTPAPTATPNPSATPTPTATPAPTATPSATPASVQLLNISGRLLVQTDDKVGIGGFIIQGSDFKRVIVRALGPSVRANGNPVPGALQNPVLELHDSSGGILANDNWRDQQETEIEQTGLAPGDDNEAAIVTPLRQGNYTAIIRGANNSTGVGLVEIYDLQSTNSAKLGNLSVRAHVGTDDNVLIDGLILGGGTPKRVLFRAIGPSLQTPPGTLPDPTLELHDGNGVLMQSNNDWKDAPNAAEIEATGLAPTHDRESAILMTLTSGNYTAIVSGASRTTGVAVAEAYKLD